MLVLLVFGTLVGVLALFAAPAFSKAVDGFFLLGFCLALLLVAIDSALLGWALLASCGSVGAFCRLSKQEGEELPPWLISVPAFSALWLLGLVLLGTFQEAFLPKNEVPFSSAALMDFFGSVFGKYFFATLLFVLLGWSITLALEENE
jgi:hypothetical protein